MLSILESPPPTTLEMVHCLLLYKDRISSVNYYRRMNEGLTVSATHTLYNSPCARCETAMLLDSK